MTQAAQTVHDERDPERDLVLERVIDVPPERVWRAWTEPEQLRQWFTPAPWSTAAVDLRPGGIFSVVMCNPEGEEVPQGTGCYLEVVPNRRLVWTGALGAGFRPNKRAEGDLLFTAVISMEPHGSGTKYTAYVIHEDAADAQRHAEMGFHDGWGAALDQLMALVRAG
ncbi:MAG: polyketide cyclase [Chloroflexi bacterium]|nr:polyketide cyclase [Chloroflexota bacterium]